MRRDCGDMADHSDGFVTQTSTCGKGNSKPVGRAPITTCGAPARLRVLPTAWGSPLRRRCHRPALIITTGAPPGVSSSGKKLRPSRGFTPRILRKLAETRAALRTSGSALPESVRFSMPIANAPTSLNDLPVWISSKWAMLAPAHRPQRVEEITRNRFHGETERLHGIDFPPESTLLPKSAKLSQCTV